MLCFCFTLSMAPVGRLYLGDYLKIGTWHDQAVQKAYWPLLYLVAQSEWLYELQLRYSNLCAGIIPRWEVRRKAGYSAPPPLGKMISSGLVLPPSYPKTWWWNARFRAMYLHNHTTPGPKVDD